MSNQQLSAALTTNAQPDESNAEGGHDFEQMLQAQMLEVHAAAMSAARRLSLAEYPILQDAAMRALCRCSTTFAMQIEALKRYRGGGEQRIVVERITINDGGRAIVGAVTGGGSSRVGHQPHAPGETVPSDSEAIPQAVRRASS